MSKNLKIGIMVLILIILAGIYFFKIDSLKPNLNTKDKVNQSEQKAGTAVPENKISKEIPNNLPMLIDLGADTCIPCKKMKPILDEVKKEYEEKAIVKIIDVYENRAEAMKYGIRAIPTQIFFDASGKEVFRHEGYFSKKEIVEKFREMGLE